MFKHLQTKQLFDIIKNEITVYPPQEATEIAFWLLEHYLKLTKTDVLIGRNIENDETDWGNIISKINANEPIQYIIGETVFAGLHFFVNPAVLIPRPETEQLVNMIIQELKTNEEQRYGGKEVISNEDSDVINEVDVSLSLSKGNHSILDIGTGSGCIAISLAKALPASSIFAWDISASALETATQNALINKVENVRFEKTDILNYNLQGTNQKIQPTSNIKYQTSNISIIVSNPPYIRPSESVEMRENVTSHEPHLALFIPENDPLLFYRAIARFAQNNLAENGQIWLEINEQFGQETALLFEEHGFINNQILQDFQGKDRFIRSSR